MIETYRLSNIWPEHSGVPGVVIWFACGEFDHEHSDLGPRIRIVPEGSERAADITLENSPRMIGKLPVSVHVAAVAWVQMNREALLRHWIDQTDTAECLRELVRVDGSPVVSQPPERS